MAIVVAERWDTRSGSEGPKSGSLEIVYVVADAIDENDACQAVAAEAPLSVTLPRGRLVVFQGFDWEPADGDLWHITSKYGDVEPREEGDFDFSFDTTGGTYKRTQAIQNKANYAHPDSPNPAPDYGGAIAVTDQGVEGCDVPGRSFKWTETHTMPLAVIAFTAYSSILEALTGTKNAAQFRGRPAHSVIFHGAQGGKKDAETAEVTFSFEAGENITAGTFGVFEDVDKEAWDFIWFGYEEKEDDDAKKLVRKAISCHVEEVVPEADWDAMGIGD